jgi:non-homologous end joining protein Ku
MGGEVPNGLTSDIKKFIDRLTCLETERELILKETLVFIDSLRKDKQFSCEEIIKPAKQKAFEVANELIGKTVKF